MTSDEMLSAREIDILSSLAKGVALEALAKTYGLDESELKTLVAIAEKKRDKLREMDKKAPVPYNIRAITGDVNVVQKGTMKVGSQILKQLSEGIYTSPAGSIKELISNAYDSDAPKVTITIGEDKIVVEDTGKGMDWNDFDSEFTFISRSTKRIKGQTTKKYKRPIIGFIGIGFIAVSEVCDVLTIISGKENGDTFFKAVIDFSEYRTHGAFDKEFYEVSKYELVNLKKEDYDIPYEKSFTEITLSKLRPGFKRILSDKKPFGNKVLTIEKIWEKISKDELGLTDLGSYWQMILELAYITPVKYMDDGPIRGIKDNILSEIQSKLDEFNFKVIIDKMELLKPIKFPTNEDIIKSKEYKIHSFAVTIPTAEGELSFSGYIYSQHKIIKPREYMGIAIRVKNTAVGGFDRSLLGYPSGSNQLFRNWIFGEIYVHTGLEEALNINRSSFKVAHPHYIELTNWLHEFLDKTVFKYTYDEYYIKGREQRQEEQANNYLLYMQNLVKSELGRDYTFSIVRSLTDDFVCIDKQKKTVTVNRIHPILSKTPKKYVNMLETMLVLFEISLEKSNDNAEALKKNYLQAVKKWKTK